jgi:hypothetical protein
MKTYFVRGTSLSGDLDIKTYDVAQLHLHKTGSAEVNGGGELWVEYDVQLLTPQIKHESEALGTHKRTLIIYDATTGAPVNLGSIKNDMDAEVYLGRTGTSFDWGVRTPGLYDVCIDTVENVTPNTITLLNPVLDDSVRDSTLSSIQNFLASGNVQATYRAIMAVLETADYPNATARVNMEQTVSAGTGENWITITELLPGNPFRDKALKLVKEKYGHEKHDRFVKFLDRNKKKCKPVEVLKERKTGTDEPGLTLEQFKKLGELFKISLENFKVVESGDI